MGQVSQSGEDPIFVYGAFLTNITNSKLSFYLSIMTLNVLASCLAYIAILCAIIHSQNTYDMSTLDSY